MLNDPIRISQGDAGQVNKDVTQIVHIMRQGKLPYNPTWIQILTFR